jgi:hypothetical protein
VRPRVKNEEAVKPRPEANPAFRLSVTVEPLGMPYACCSVPSIAPLATEENAGAPASMTREPPQATQPQRRSDRARWYTRALESAVDGAGLYHECYERPTSHR